MKATRNTATRRLKSFLPNAGKKYASTRNYDHGTNQHENVSVLSPYITHRLISEAEVIQATLSSHSPAAAEKFIQEVCWRTYWKGWLEMRPSVWTDYLEHLRESHESMSDYPDDRDEWHRATNGETGIECFDAWVHELRETGYLHNHARMWFASIWIFTLGLPWSLGADFFYRNLLDGDPASNTLSWRWVAGLHTKGKHYVARASNIAKYTDGRFNPAGQLNENPEPLVETMEHERITYDAGDSVPESDARTGLWLHPEDLSPETRPAIMDRVQTAVTFAASPSAGNLPFAPHVEAFKQQASQDAISRIAIQTTTLPGDDPASEMVSWAMENRIEQVWCMKPCVGPWASLWEQLQTALHKHGVSTSAIRRSWDRDLHPHATAGYFRFKKKIPSIINAVNAYT